MEAPSTMEDYDGPTSASAAVHRFFGATTDDAAIFLEDTMDRSTAQCISSSPSAIAILSPQRLPARPREPADVTEYDSRYIGGLGYSSGRKKMGRRSVVLGDVTNGATATRLSFGRGDTPVKLPLDLQLDAAGSSPGSSRSRSRGRGRGPDQYQHGFGVAATARRSRSRSSDNATRVVTGDDRGSASFKSDGGAAVEADCEEDETVDGGFPAGGTTHHSRLERAERSGSRVVASSCSVGSRRRFSSASTGSPQPHGPRSHSDFVTNVVMEPMIPLAEFERVERERNRYQKMYEHQKVLYEETAEKQQETYNALQEKIVEVVALSTRNEESKRFIRQLKREMAESRTRVVDMQNRALEDSRNERSFKAKYSRLLDVQQARFSDTLRRNESRMAGLESLVRDLTCMQEESDHLQVSQLDALLRAAYTKNSALFGDLLRQNRQLDMLHEGKQEAEKQVDALRRERRELENLLMAERRRSSEEHERLMEQIEEQQRSILELRQMLIRTLAAAGSSGDDDDDGQDADNDNADDDDKANRNETDDGNRGSDNELDKAHVGGGGAERRESGSPRRAEVGVSAGGFSSGDSGEDGLGIRSVAADSGPWPSGEGRDPGQTSADVRRQPGDAVTPERAAPDSVLGDLLSAMMAPSRRAAAGGATQTGHAGRAVRDSTTSLSTCAQPHGHAALVRHSTRGDDLLATFKASRGFTAKPELMEGAGASVTARYRHRLPSSLAGAPADDSSLYEGAATDQSSIPPLPRREAKAESISDGRWRDAHMDAVHRSRVAGMTSTPDAPAHRPDVVPAALPTSIPGFVKVTKRAVAIPPGRV